MYKNAKTYLFKAQMRLRQMQILLLALLLPRLLLLTAAYSCLLLAAVCHCLELLAAACSQILLPATCCSAGNSYQFLQSCLLLLLLVASSSCFLIFLLMIRSDWSCVFRSISTQVKWLRPCTDPELFEIGAEKFLKPPENHPWRGQLSEIIDLMNAIDSVEIFSK